MARAKGRTQNPKFKGGPAGQVGSPYGSGMNVGGNTDQVVRENVWGAQHMLSKQLKKNKSAGLKPPGR